MLLNLLVFLSWCAGVIAPLADVINVMKSDGYNVEIHRLVTEDGYIIELHRIPKGRWDTSAANQTSETTQRRKIAFLAPCWACSSSAFVVLGPTTGLAYKLANSGYDVWIPNVRGTKYSKRHLRLSPKSLEYWKFGWHEQAIYDIPQSIDYVLKTTGETQVDYIGYSLGTTQFFAMMSEKPEYGAKIKSMIAMAPPVYLNSSRGFLPGLTPLTIEVASLGAKTGWLQMPLPELQVPVVLSKICDPKMRFLQPFCIKVLELFSMNGNYNLRTLPFFFKFFPDSISLRSVIHFAQLRNTARFQKYNFGRALNKIKYGALTPPTYNLSAITVPVSLIWGDGDNFVRPEDVSRLKAELPNVVSDYRVPLSGFSHVDFIWGRNASSLVYDIILQQLKAISP